MICTAGEDYSELANLARVLADLDALTTTSGTFNGPRFRRHWVGGENRIMRKLGGRYVVVTLMWDTIRFTVGNIVYTLPPGENIFRRSNGGRILWNDVIGDIHLYLV